MKQARYSLWPEDPAVSRRRSQARLIAISFVAGIGFTALWPFALTYVGGWVVPTQIATPAAQVAKAHMPGAPAITAQFETLSQRLRQHAAVEHAAPPVRENAEDGASDIAAPRTTVADVPLPIPRPPDVEEVSRE
jgi:hypothetical protein